MLIFTVWLTSTYYVTGRLAEAQARSASIYAQFLRDQELLFTISRQVLLGSVYVRDALIESAEQSAAVAHYQIRNLQAQVERELEHYETIDSSVDAAAWRRLEKELRDYWETAARLTAPESASWTWKAASSLLHTQVIQQREVITQLSDEIRQMMARDYLQEEKQLNDVHVQLRRRLWETTAVAVILGFGVAFLATRYAARLEAQIREDHAEVARNRGDLQRLSERLVRVQEDERRTVARELHDEIGQALTAVKVELAVALRSVGADRRAVAALAEARMVTEHALSNVRDLSQLLRPAMLDDFGLPDTLKWYLRKFSDRTGIRTELVDDRLSERLPTDVEVSAYRAIQEGLTNVSRHAHATSCRVFVQRLPSSLIVTVEDDGRGFRAGRDSTGDQGAGLGLVGIRERAVNLGGTFRIESGDKGTRLTIEFPLTAGAQA